jgi:hypothetical protein
MIGGIESAKLKIDRATVHIEEFKLGESRYTATQPDAISQQPDSAPKLQFTEAPPPCLAVIAGEVIYQLRSALDHLAFDIVKLNPNKVVLPDKWEGRCQFPLLSQIPTKGNPAMTLSPLPRDHFDNSLPGISDNAFTLIESLQPYHGGDGPTQLGIIGALSNVDKHRHLHVINPQAYHRQIYTDNRFITEIAVRVRDGAELIPTEPHSPDSEYVHGGVANPFVTFDESVLDKRTADLPVEYILELCTKAVSDFVIPAFEKLVQNP